MSRRLNSDTNYRAYLEISLCLVKLTLIHFAGGILASSLFLIVFSAGGGVDGINLNMLWRVVAGISIIPPLAVFIFRMRMLNSKLYVKNAIQKNVPYLLMFKYYGKSLFGTAGSWLLYDLVAFANGACEF